MLDDLLFAIAVQFPIVATILIGIVSGVVRIYRRGEREEEREEQARLYVQHADEVAYREQLRLHALAERDAAVARLEAQWRTLKDATNVMDRSVALNEKLAEAALGKTQVSSGRSIPARRTVSDG